MAIVERGVEGDVDFLLEALRVVAEAVMDADVSAKIGAGHGERSADRLTYRNGYRSRQWDIRVGTMELRIPKLREGSYFPSLLEPRRRSEKALLAVVQQAYVERVSTRRVDDLVKALGCDGISKSQVSRICGEPRWYRNLTLARRSVWPTPGLAQLLTPPPLTRTSNLPHLKVSDDIQSLSRIICWSPLGILLPALAFR